MSTIIDVAKQAKVSTATVSNVFNKPERVNVKTREKVLSVAKVLNFQPNPYARGLRNQKTGMVAIAVPDISFYNSAQVAKGAHEYLKENHRLGLITNIGFDKARVIEQFKTLHTQGVSGFIVSALPNSRFDADILELLLSYEKEGAAVVYIGNNYETMDVNVVLNQSQQGCKTLVNHLASLGHKDIAYLSFYHSKGMAVKRWLGFQEGLLEASLDLNPEYVIEGEISLEAGVRGLEQLLSLPRPPTAIMTASDIIASGVVNAAYRLGIKIPDDLSVTGFDAMPISEFATPSITSISIPTYELGSKAAEILLARLQDSEKPKEKAYLPFELLIRESTASPKSNRVPKTIITD